MRLNVLVLTLLGLCVARAATYFPGEGDVDVSVWQTSGREAFQELETTPFTPHLYTNQAPIVVDTAATIGTYRRLGVSMTDASCWVLSKLAPERRRALLEAVFSPTKGANLRGVRLNIGASDYSTALYNYDETPSDVSMAHFSMARDDRWLFPMVREAMAVNPDLWFFAAPWSPPGWMKTTGSFVDGHFRDGMELALANYLVAYVKGCADRGVDVKAVSIQNESGLSTHGTYPSCVFRPDQSAAVARTLAARLGEERLAAKVWVWDWDYKGATNDVPAILAAPGTREAVGGIAWHSYGRSKGEWIRPIKAAYPEIPFFHTEMGPALHDPKRTEWWWTGKLAEAFTNGCEMFTGWNLCLTANGTPLVGPHLCAGLVTVDLKTGDFTPSAQYTVFRHVGPFVKDGAEVLGVNGATDGMNVLLFRNPGGEYVLVAASEGVGTTKYPRPKLTIRLGNEMKLVEIPWGTWSVTTVVFKKR